MRRHHLLWFQFPFCCRGKSRTWSVVFSVPDLDRDLCDENGRELLGYMDEDGHTIVINCNTKVREFETTFLHEFCHLSLAVHEIPYNWEEPIVESLGIDLATLTKQLGAEIVLRSPLPRWSSGRCVIVTGPDVNAQSLANERLVFESTTHR